MPNSISGQIRIFLLIWDYFLFTDHIRRCLWRRLACPNIKIIGCTVHQIFFPTSLKSFVFFKMSPKYYNKSASSSINQNKLVSSSINHHQAASIRINQQQLILSNSWVKRKTIYRYECPKLLGQWAYILNLKNWDMHHHYKSSCRS